ncbi:hypothetical protein [uncultured Shewanella sp.]|uniref:hypothetical protein n=1 Tax=uncultured Shewanella sp. TaxID=173975 RepID=UPI002624776D|nr:hypothetical protein [uncultured Shewanella sp.]
MLTEEERQYILDDISPSLIKAAKEVELAQRYQSLLTQFPKREGDFNPRLSSTEQRAIIAQYPHPVRFYKGQGGYYKLNQKKTAFPHISLTMEMRQWVCCSVGLWCDDKRIGGGGYQHIALAERLSRGESISWKDWSESFQPWTYDEQQFNTVIAEYFSLYEDLCQQIPN